MRIATNRCSLGTVRSLVATTNQHGFGFHAVPSICRLNKVYAKRGICLAVAIAEVANLPDSLVYPDRPRMELAGPSHVTGE